MLIKLTPDGPGEEGLHTLGEPPELDEVTAEELWRRADERVAYFDTHYDELKRLYPDEFVAVRDKMVIDHDADLVLQRRALRPATLARSEWSWGCEDGPGRVGPAGRSVRSAESSLWPGVWELGRLGAWGTIPSRPTGWWG